MTHTTPKIQVMNLYMVQSLGFLHNTQCALKSHFIRVWPTLNSPPWQDWGSVNPSSPTYLIQLVWTVHVWGLEIRNSHCLGIG